MAELHNRYCLELLFFGLVKQRRERKDANVNRKSDGREGGKSFVPHKNEGVKIVSAYSTQTKPRAVAEAGGQIEPAA